MSRKGIEAIGYLTPAQQGILFHSLETPDSSVYLGQTSWLLEGELDTQAFEQAWQRALERHPILRTAFVWEGVDEPVQVVRQKVVLPLELQDWSEVPRGEMEERLDAFLEEDRRRTFSLTRPPLLRLTLFRLGPMRHRLVWSSHHLLLDGWSKGLVLQDVVAHYEAFLAGDEPSLPRPRPFLDFVRWMRKQDRGALESHWRHQLEGYEAPVEVELNGHHHREATGVEVVSTSLTERETESLKELAGRHQATLNNILQAVWAVLLSRYSGRDDVVFGTVVSGRPEELPGVEAMVGMFINTLPMRLRVGAEGSAADLLERASKQQLDLFRVQHSALVEIQGWSDVEAGRNLFDTILVFENYADTEASEAHSGSLRIGDLRMFSSTNYPLSLIVVPSRTMELDLHFDVARFDSTAARRMLTHLRNLLKGVVQEPSPALGALSLLDAGERHQLIVEWNDTARFFSPHGTLPELIEAQARRSPGATALVFEDESITYAELLTRADDLAGALRALGVGPEKRVGVCLHRSTELVVGLLAVLRAGGAYVPLDPDYPAGRLEGMLQDAGVSVLLTRTDLTELLPDVGAPVLHVDQLPSPGAAPQADDGRAASASSLAYVIFTSGSTGRPKGAMNEHRGIVNRLLWMQERYGLTAADRVLQKTPFSFDVSVWEFFWPLLTGATLVVARPGGHRDPAYLAEVVREKRVTFLHFVPSMLQAFLEEPSAATCSDLRQVVVSGEALPFELEQRFFECLPEVAFENLYGPTEAAVDVSYHPCAPSAVRRPLPIGRPVANTSLAILDRDFRPAPLGVAGEICIGGVQGGRGYLDRPSLTAQRFVPNPVAEEAGARVYRTGDLGRFLDEGEIDFLGRIDFQVKLRGFRIELGEVEAALAAHGEVERAAALVRTDVPGDPRLVAYVVAPQESAPSAGALRDFVQGRLPEYMVPAAIVFLDSFPLTPSGKLDRRSLPAPELSREKEALAPSTPSEQLIAGIWARVLGLEWVGAEESFFALGGHSLLATRIVSEVRKAFGVELPISAIFDSPTVATLAARVERLRSEGEKWAAPPLKPREEEGDGEIPLSYSQLRQWFLVELEPDLRAYNLPYVLRFRGTLQVAALHRSLDEVVRRHEVLRTTFREGGSRPGGPRQLISPLESQELPLIDLSGLPEEVRSEVWRTLTERDSWRLFDLRRGPLVRASLVRTSPEEHLLTSTMHHIVTDGWSLGIFAREMVQLYRAFAAGEASPLPELPIQYADFALWQRQWLQGDNLDRLVEFWRNLLKGSQDLELSTDRPRPAVQSHRGTALPIRLGKELTAGLRQLAGRAGATPHMALVGAFSTVLGRFASTSRVNLGTYVANRTRGETEDLIGFFVNTLVLPTDLSGNPPFEGLLGRVRETTLAAYEHQDLPFETLLDRLEVQRDMSRSSLFQAHCQLQNYEPALVEMPGLEVEPASEVEISVTHYDLTLWMEQGPEEIWGELQYALDLFDATTAQRIGHWLVEILKGAVAKPDQSLEELTMLSKVERHQGSVEWNETPGREAFQPVQERIAHWARTTPTAPAVFAGGATVTYGGLEARANQLARFLVSLGAGLGERVGICLEGTAERIAAVLAVLKSGAAYVPLDPDYSSDRLGFMAEDCQARLILTSSDLAARLPELGRTEARVIELDASTASDRSADSFSAPALPEALAYLVYTSGSTGRPKGVMVRHAGLENAYVGWQESYRLLTDARRHLQMASFSFDVFAGDLVRALCSGGCLVLCPRDFLLDPPALYRLMVEAQVDAAEFVPAVVRGLLDHLRESGDDLSFMRLMVVGSDVWSNAEMSAVQRLVGPATRVISSYGVSEATIDSTAFEDEGFVLPAERPVPIGRPFTGTVLRMLGKDSRPVPIGVPGELALAGPNLARGYHGQPALTASRFVPDPAGGAGDRLYRSGDLARFLANGQVEFLGRTDFQVKIRGYRIEPGEIEGVLEELPTVARAAVAPRRRGSGGPVLVAYLVAAGGAELVPMELRRQLADLLPEYMVPSTFVVLEAMPLTANGKVDRRALPEPDWQAPELASEHIPPEGALEELLAKIWSEILGVERVGRSDSFFDLGGHSLLATQVISRIRRELDREVPLRTLFEAPTLAALAARLQGETGDFGDSPPQTVAPLEARPAGMDRVPLSFAQQRLWLIHQLEPESPAYNIPSFLRLEGDLESRFLEQAFVGMATRHEDLRTVFLQGEGEPVQVILPPEPRILPVVDLGNLEEQDRQRTLEELCRREALRPFDLETGPLLRYWLARLDLQEHVLASCIHHVISDYWSVAVMVREITALYDAGRRGVPPQLPELAVQYADFTLWQRSWLSGEVLDAQLDYWKAQLEEAPAALDLPTDRPRPPVQLYQGAAEPLQFDRDLQEALQGLSRQQGATLFMVLLAGFQALLKRLTGQTHVSVGSPIANRTRSELEELIGFFANTLVLSTDLGRRPSFQELLDRVREVTLGAYAHQDLPFEKLVEAVSPQRDQSRHPLFQVMLVMLNAPHQSVDLDDLSMTMIPSSSATAKFDLTLLINESPAGLAGGIEYDTALFDASTVVRLLDQLRRLFEGVVAEPDVPLAEIAILSSSERQQVMTGWQPSAAETLTDLGGLHRLVERQARETPLALAVVDAEGGGLTYRQLDHRANALANCLLELGVRPDGSVAICLGRTVDLPVAVLGAMKAGAACLSLDPAYPEERLSFMMEDSGAPVLVTDRELAERLPVDLLQQTTLMIESLEGEELQKPPEIPAHGEHLAYLIYTSGSTGVPKGVAMRHGALLNLMAWQLRSGVPANPRGRTLQFAALSFDVSFQELFATLGFGGTLVMVPEEVRRDGFALLRYLDRLQVETLYLPFVALQQLAEAAASTGSSPAALRDLVTAGEQLRVTPEVQDLLSRLPGSRLHNQYGPSEAHVVTAWTRSASEGEQDGWPPLPPIGIPVDNVPNRILNEVLEPTGVGVPGELYLGGACLARGYLDRPGLTASKFLPDPHGAAGARMYHTGDLARWLPSGDIEFLGRADHQVKVRGFRVEPGEIEEHLEGLPGVSRAVVVAKGDSGQTRLVGYLVAEEESLLEASKVRSSLLEQLPEYMVPSQILVLEELPLTPSGKVDRRSLPEPEEAAGGENFVPPATAVEELLAGLWTAVLPVSRVGREDSFFDLGGHSLLATQVISRIRTAFGVEIPLRSLFEGPRLRDLAQKIQETSRTDSSLLRPPLVAISRDGLLPLSFSQQRLWFIDQLEPGTAAYNLPAGLRLRGSLSRRSLEEAVGEIVRRHESLRTTFAGSSGQAVQVVHETPLTSGAALLPVVDLGGLEEESRRREAGILQAREVSQGFDLQKGPLFRTLLLETSEDEHVLIVNMSHIVSDGWSVGILIQELSALYGAFEVGEPSPLAELAIQYPDYAAWQRGWLSGDALEEQLSWWRDSLGGVTPDPLELPTDRPRPPVMSTCGADRPFQLPEDLQQAVEELTRDLGATSFMVLLASLSALMSRLSGQGQVVVGSPIANRAQEEVESLIGFFVNTLALRLDLRKAESFTDLVRQARETTLGAFAHQDLPFEKLVEELDPERDASRSPLFQVMFVQQNAPQADLSLTGLEAESLGMEMKVAKFDLTLAVADSARGLVGSWNFNTDLFDTTTVDRWHRSWLTILQAVVTDPEAPLTALSMLAPVEAHQILREWNGDRVPYPRDSSVADLFREQVMVRPLARALDFHDGTLTYGELEERANGLAWELRSRGVMPGDFVGLFLDRSLELVVGMLACLKAGAAFIPIDLAYPEDRVAFILQDADAAAVLTDDGLKARLPARWQEAALTSFRTSPGRSEPPVTDLDASAAAYVMYTSGSTGRPKGVIVPHRGIVRLVRNATYVQFGPLNRVAQCANPAFDASTFEIWGALVNGGTLVGFTKEQVLDSAVFASRIREKEVALLVLTTAVFNKIAQEEPTAYAPLAGVLYGGEAADPAAVQRVLDHGPPGRLINGYGPTENTTFTSTFCSVAHETTGETVPIGRPLTNTDTYVLDRLFRPVPPGVAGELCTGGDGLAQAISAGLL